ncbi:tyrosine-type recombinase/integrase [Devosia sp. RR2S18]|uniref:tyrosine-type recombinase/integrase n=1 Tax=Devosia rhizosphaerae TaxID=3049774 RepID=UPI002540C7C1|nr:tyrosine-type recombinase/integrase [Devosia sp. RR2S18]WIJ23986.1 tyrosine-type recombinase/integrase [Devosia sp. RR2S18]
MRRFLDPVVVSRVLKKLAHRHDQEAELERDVSGHSLRVGAAQQLTIDGHGVLQIMRAGGWKSMNVVARYIENVDLDLWR